MSRQAHVTYRSACALEKIPNRVRVHDDSGPAPFQRIRSTLQNIDVPALVSKNQSCGESAERPPITMARIMRPSRWRGLLARTRAARRWSYLPGSPRW